MPLTGPQIKRLRDAIVLVCPNEGMLTNLFLYGMNVRINNIVAPGSLDDRVRELIVWTEAQGRTEELIAAAINDVPKNQVLRKIAQDLRMDSGAGQFESIVRRNFEFSDVEKWRDGMIKSEQAVCRVEVNLIGEDEGVGTAFLVATDLVITNYHVVSQFILGQLDPVRATFHFDYKVHEGKLLAGTKYKLAKDWLVHSSLIESLDFALLRLAVAAGEGTLGNMPDSPIRGFLKPTSDSPNDGDPLMIIQHPKAVPLQFALGVVRTLEPPAAPDYLTYDVNTEEGSSGSPCFANDWSLVAIHHYGGEHHNRGIRFSAILDELRRKNITLES